MLFRSDLDFIEIHIISSIYEINFNFAVKIYKNYFTINQYDLESKEGYYLFISQNNEIILNNIVESNSWYIFHILPNEYYTYNNNISLIYYSMDTDNRMKQYVNLLTNEIINKYEGKFDRLLTQYYRNAELIKICTINKNSK